MNSDEIRAAITADLALQALVPDTQAIADALSVGRKRSSRMPRMLLPFPRFRRYS